jgi:hypothetical protein
MLGAEVVARSQDVPADTGGLKSSIKAVGIRESRSEIIADAPHAGIIEAGARPHLTPLQPLIDWVNRHKSSFGLRRPRGGRPGIGAGANERESRRRERQASKYAEYDREVLQIAAGIRAKIAREGSKPRWWMKKHLPELRRILSATINRRIKDET